MNAEDIEVGWKYKIDGVGTWDRGFYTILDVRKNKVESWEVIAKHPNDSYSRTFRPEQVLAADKKKVNGRAVIENKIKATLLEEIEGPWPEGCRLFNVEIHYWPLQAKRGRKKGS